MRRPSQKWTLPDQDRDLVHRVLSGEATAIESFLDRMDVIRSVVGRLNRGQHRPLAADSLDDLHQTIFAAVWKQLPTFRGECQLSTWVFRIAFNLFQLEVRKRARRQVAATVSAEGEAVGEMISQAEAPATQAEREDEMTRVLVACETLLNQHQRTVVYARLMEGVSYEELAARTGRPQSSLRSDLSRAIQIIREKLGRRCDE